MRGDIDGANLLAGLGIERVQLVSRRKPHVLAVVGDPGDVFDPRKRAVFAEDFGLRFFRGSFFHRHMTFFGKIHCSGSCFNRVAAGLGVTRLS